MAASGGRGYGWPRNDGLAALLPWACSLMLIVALAATSEFDYRYVTTAVPFGCLALAVAFGRTVSAGPWLARLRLRRFGAAPVRRRSGVRRRRSGCCRSGVRRFHSGVRRLAR